MPHSTDGCEFVLQYLRWALANNIEVLRVIDIKPRREGSDGITPTRIVIDISNFPIENRKGSEFPITAPALAAFLTSSRFREEFIGWYGKQFAASLPIKRGMEGWKKRFANLTVGRPGALPPRLYLRTEFDRFTIEIKALQLKAELPLNDRRTKLLIAFGRETSARWIGLVESKKISIYELVQGNPKSIAEVILSKLYNCTEESVHSRLFQRTKR